MPSSLESGSGAQHSSNLEFSNLRLDERRGFHETVNHTYVVSSYT